jgi:hypothetical protein
MNRKMKPAPSSSVSAAAEIKQAAYRALLVATLIEVPLALIFMLSGASDASAASDPSANPIRAFVSLTQFPGAILLAGPAADALRLLPFTPSGADSAWRTGIALAGVNLLILALVAFLSLRALQALRPRARR